MQQIERLFFGYGPACAGADAVAVIAVAGILIRAFSNHLVQTNTQNLCEKACYMVFLSLSRFVSSHFFVVHSYVAPFFQVSLGLSSLFGRRIHVKCKVLYYAVCTTLSQQISYTFRGSSSFGDIFFSYSHLVFSNSSEQQTNGRRERKKTITTPKYRTH